MDALMLYLRSDKTFPMLTKDIYPTIAKKYGMSTSSVERNIRRAVGKMQQQKSDTYNEIFSYVTAQHITNGEFLSVMSDYIGKNIKRTPVAGIAEQI